MGALSAASEAPQLLKGSPSSLQVPPAPSKSPQLLPRSFQFSNRPSPGLPVGSEDLASFRACSEALPAGSEALSPGSEAIPAGSEARSTGSEARSTGSEALSTRSEALPAGSEALSTGAEALPAGSEA